MVAFASGAPAAAGGGFAVAGSSAHKRNAQLVIAAMLRNLKTSARRPIRPDTSPEVHERQPAAVLSLHRGHRNAMLLTRAALLLGWALMPKVFVRTARLSRTTTAAADRGGHHRLLPRRINRICDWRLSFHPRRQPGGRHAGTHLLRTEPSISTRSGHLGHFR